MVLLAVAILFAAFMLIRAVCMLCKRSERRRELKHHISIIQDTAGCDRASCYYRECMHIVEHYGILLSEVGYDGDLMKLRDEANDSIERAATRRMKTKPIVTPELNSSLA